MAAEERQKGRRGERETRWNKNSNGSSSSSQRRICRKVVDEVLTCGEARSRSRSCNLQGLEHFSLISTLALNIVWVNLRGKWSKYSSGQNFHVLFILFHVLQANLMQRMTDALSRMLNDPSTRNAMRNLQAYRSVVRQDWTSKCFLFSPVQ